jgi:hypothetical protein
VYELPPTIFQNLEARYAKSNVSVVIPTTLVEVNYSNTIEEDSSTSIIAVHVV